LENRHLKLSPKVRKSRFAFAQWKKAKVNIDYHVELDRHYYSVPHQYVREEVQIRYTETSVEIFYQSARIASHLRSFKAGKPTTLAEHMPKSHQKHLQWSPSRMIQWGASIGPQTAQFMEQLLQSKAHPEQGYRSCLGIIRLGKHYSNARLESACQRANFIGSPRYGSVRSILEKGLDRFEVEVVQSLEIQHENVRGSDYYQNPKKGEFLC
jgi:transposase